MLTEKLTVKLLALAEATLPVNDAKVAGVHAWPILRAYLYGSLLDLHVLTGPVCQTPAWQATSRMIEAAYASHVDDRSRRPPLPVKAFRPSDRIGGMTWLPADQTSLDCLFLYRGDEHYLKTQQGFYAPVLDPWFEVACELGRAVKLEWINEVSPQRRPLRHPALAWAPTLQSGGMEFSDQESVAGLAQLFLNFADGFNVDLGPYFVSDVIHHFDELYQLKRAMEPVFANLKPRMLFLTCNYSINALAALWAASDHGTLTVEVQHGGYLCPFHIGYSHWTAVPETGYATLPRIFLTWDIGSSNNIAGWLPDHGSPHRVILGGALIHTIPVMEQVIEALRARCAGHSKIVLVTLQKFAGVGVPDLVVEAMKSAPRDWFWFLRSHPSSMSYPQGMEMLLPANVEHALRSAGLDNFDCIDATEAPLPALLRLVDHHITGSSSTVVDCFAYNVPTTCFHPMAKDNYPNFLDSGVLDYVETAADLLRSIGAGDVRRAQLHEAVLMPADRVFSRNVLERLLDAVGP